MDFFPGLIKEKIDFYLWRIKIKTINHEYHSSYEFDDKWSLLATKSWLSDKNHICRFVFNARTFPYDQKGGYRYLIYNIKHELRGRIFPVADLPRLYQYSLISDKN